MFRRARGLSDQVEVSAAIEVCVGLGQQVLRGSDDVQARCGSSEPGARRLVRSSGVFGRPGGRVVPVAVVVVSGIVIHIVALV